MPNSENVLIKVKNVKGYCVLVLKSTNFSMLSSVMANTSILFSLVFLIELMVLIPQYNLDTMRHKNK